MDDVTLPRRVVRTGFWLAVVLVLLFNVGGRPEIGAGLAVGSALSLFSVWSIAWLTPRAANPQRPRAWLPGLAMLVKLPLYGVVLYYALSSPRVNAGAVLAGVCLAPAVIALKALGRMLTESRGEAGAAAAVEGKEKK